MNYKKIVLFLFVLILAFSLFASKSYIYPHSSPLYEWMEMLYTLEGLSSPSSSYPWSSGEVEMMINKIKERNIDNKSVDLLNKIEDLNNKNIRENKSYISASLTLSPEMYIHTNSDNYEREDQWIKGYSERSPFLDGAIELGFGSFFYTTSSLQYAWGRTTHKDEFIHLKDVPGYVGLGALVDKNNSSATVVSHSYVYSLPFVFNFPDISSLDIETPNRALISIGGEKWFLTLSKDRLKWDKSHIGSFIFDDHLNYQKYLRAKFFDNNLSLEYVLSFYDTNPNDGFANGDEGVRVMMAHSISYTILSSLRLNVSENVMYSSSYLDLKEMNPSYIFHNLNNSKLFNALAHVGVNYTPLKGFNIYAQFTLDQATAPTESDAQASAWGLLLGLEYNLLLFDGFMKMYIEGVYTTPELYRREKVDFLLYQCYSTNINYRHVLFFDYIGFPYGGDSICIKIGGDYLKLDLFKCGLESEFLIKGELDMLHSHNKDGDNSKIPNIKDTTPTGNANYRFYISLYGEYFIPSFLIFKENSVKLSLSYVYSTTIGSDFEIQAGVTLKI